MVCVCVCVCIFKLYFMSIGVKVSDPLELELQTVVICHVGAVLGIEPGSSERAAGALNH